MACDDPAVLNLSVVQRRSWRVELTFEITAGVPVDLSAVVLRLRAKHESTGATFEIFSPGDGIAILDALAGEAAIVVGSDVTATMEPGRWHYDFFVERAGVDSDDVPFHGTINVVPTLGG